MKDVKADKILKMEISNGEDGIKELLLEEAKKLTDEGRIISVTEFSKIY
jgi:hypothetical protein